MSLDVSSNYGMNLSSLGSRNVELEPAGAARRQPEGRPVDGPRDDGLALEPAALLKAEVAGMQEASAGAQRAVTMLQVADGGMGKVSDLLLRMKSLSLQAQSGLLDDGEKARITAEFQDLSKQIDDIAKHTRYGERALLAGPTGRQLHIPPDPPEPPPVRVNALSAEALGVTGASLATPADAEAATGAVDAALRFVSETRTDIVAGQYRFEYVATEAATGVQHGRGGPSRLSEDDAESLSRVMSVQITREPALATVSHSLVMSDRLASLLR